MPAARYLIAIRNFNPFVVVLVVLVAFAMSLLIILNWSRLTPAAAKHP